MRLSKNSILANVCASVFACVLIGCSAADAPQTMTDDVMEIALKDVPVNVSEVVMARAPDFKMVEVLKKRREDRIYYDVEGELPNGDEIEFDVLMTENGPKVVEIQRDIVWEATPQSVHVIVDKANTDNLEVVRVIESKQADSDIIIYEVFVEGQSKRPRFEVSVAEGVPAKLLKKPAIH